MTSHLVPPPVARPGDALGSINTPALVLDLDAFEFNLRQMADLARRHGVALRPHAKAHKCVAIAQAQMALGAVGLCCQKLSEAYPFANAGIRDLLISNEFVGPHKTAMAVELAGACDLSVCVDHVEQIHALGTAADTAGVRLRVLTEIDIGQTRCGVTSQDDLLVLVEAINRYPSLRFEGLQAFNGKIQHEAAFGPRKSAAMVAIDLVASYLRCLEARGIAVETVTGGGTGTAEFDVTSGVYTEIQPGSYVIMDRHYGASEWSGAVTPRHSLKVATTVMSTHPSGRAVLDVGLKGLTLDSGLPALSGVATEQAQVMRVNDEHSVIEGQPGLFQLGDQVMVIPGHCDPTVNLYDEIVGIRNGVVESVWPVDARGLSR
jgi:D-serine deaminase-like pyridoxal phosphate-dependent protein